MGPVSMHARMFCNNTNILGRINTVDHSMHTAAQYEYLTMCGSDTETLQLFQAGGGNVLRMRQLNYGKSWFVKYAGS